MEVHEGHRSRMYEKLYHAPASLEEHELLEILLFSILPRVNTNPIAHELLDRFGTIEAIFRSTKAELMRVNGVGAKTAEFLITTGAILNRINEHREDLPRVYSTAQFKDYISEKYAPLKKEVFDIYFIDKANCILGTHRIESDLADRVVIETKDLMNAISSSKASSIILVHNHIHGSPEPSKEDDRVTMESKMICRICGMKLYDHFIYSNEWIYSYFASGRLDKFVGSTIIE